MGVIKIKFNEKLLDILSHHLNQINALVVDHMGKVIYISREYAHILGKQRENILNQQVEKVIPGTKMTKVLKEGKPILGEYWSIGNRQVIVHRYPVKKKGKVIGGVAFCVFDSIMEADGFAKRLQELEKELNNYRQRLASLQGSKYTFESIMGNSQKLRHCIDLAKQAASTPSTILITGETGTGKELFAHAIHSYSPRALGPFVRINCSALPENLLESELFGYEPGAFTGASKKGKKGLFRAADTGVLLLDEIEALPFNLQPKLLRALEEREIRPIGGDKSFPIDVKVIAITNSDLKTMVDRGDFRSDLYYRLNVVRITIPPLRQRRADIPLLVNHFIDKLNKELGVYIQGITPEGMKVLKSYSWPGNVRQLRNVMERTMNIYKKGMITGEMLVKSNPNLLAAQSSFSPKNKLKEATFKANKEITRRMLLQALEAAEGNKAKAAKLLGIHRSTLYRKLKLLNLIP